MSVKPVYGTRSGGRATPAWAPREDGPCTSGEYTYTPTYGQRSSRELRCPRAEQDDLCLQGDLPLYQRAQELAGDNLSAAISAALRRYVDVEEAKSEGYDEIIVRVGPGKGRKVRFVGVLLGEWSNTSNSRVETFRVYRGRTGKFVVHIERSPDYTMVDAEGKPAGWRGYLGLGNVSYGSAPAESHARGRRDPRRAPRSASHPSSTTWSPARTPGAAGRGPRHLTLGRPSAGEGSDDHQRRPTRDPRDRAAQVVRHRRSSSTASTSRSPKARCSRCSGRTAPGKTTTVHILSTLIAADGGEAQVAGHDVAREPDAVRAVIGLTGQFSAVDGLFTGEENLQLMADLRHLGKTDGRRRVAELLERFDLVDAAKKPVATYSGGMRRRLDLAMTLVGDPRIIFLDEPTAGLDPRSRRVMWEIIRELVADGVTIFLTTQYLDEADRLAHRIAVLDKGRLVAEGTPNELKRLVPGGHIRLDLRRRGRARPGGRTSSATAPPTRRR